MANAKHFLAYEQDHFRLVEDSLTYGFNISEPMSSNVDDQTLHELYLWPFADGVRAGAASGMLRNISLITFLIISSLLRSSHPNSSHPGIILPSTITLT